MASWLLLRSRFPFSALPALAGRCDAPDLETAYAILAPTSAAGADNVARSQREMVERGLNYWVQSAASVALGPERPRPKTPLRGRR